MKKPFCHADDLVALIALGIVLLLIYLAVFADTDRPAHRPSRFRRAAEKKKTLSLVEWGPLGSSDKEAERTLNAFFGD